MRVASLPGMLSAPTSLFDTPGFEIRRLGLGSCRLQFWGRLRPGWIGSLAAGLDQEGLRLVRGFARKLATMRWIAEFELEQPPDATNPLALDFLEIVSRDLPAASGRPLRLDDSRLVRSRRHGGSLLLEVSGPDAVGFLTALWTRLAGFSLFPEELQIETRDGRAQARLFLVGIGRCEPGESVAVALGETLKQLL